MSIPYLYFIYYAWPSFTEFFHVLKMVHMVASLLDSTQGFLVPSTRSLTVSSHIKSCLASIPNRILDRLTVYDLWILIIHTLSFLPPFLLYWLLLGNQLSCCEDTQAILRRGPCIKKTAVSLPTTSTNFLAFWVTHGDRSSGPSFHISAILPDILTATSQKTLNQTAH